MATHLVYLEVLPFDPLTEGSLAKQEVWSPFTFTSSPMQPGCSTILLGTTSKRCSMRNLSATGRNPWLVGAWPVLCTAGLALSDPRLGRLIQRHSQLTGQEALREWEVGLATACQRTLLRQRCC